MLHVNPGRPGTPGEHALLWGRGLRYFVPSFAGPLSVKSVLAGSARWTTDEAGHELGTASYLVINDAHPYTIEIDSRDPVETFCVFFARGFVEDAARTREEADLRLLDDPEGAGRPRVFREVLGSRGGSVGAALVALRQAVKSPKPGIRDAEDALAQLALALAHEDAEGSARHRRISAAKASTRDEVFRRVCIARDLLESSLDEPLRLADLGRAARLSPFHLHRHFRKAFGQTPQAYRRQRRLERAAATLRSSATPVTEVALDAGFSSLGSFSSLFKRAYGVSPLGYRARSGMSKIEEAAGGADR